MNLSNNLFMKIDRIIPLSEVLNRKSVLLLGPRRTGKSYYLNNQLKVDRKYDLLDPETFRRLSSRPEIIREELTGKEKIIAIDEIQKIPSLMDLVHLLIEKNHVKFLLTGSSARKLNRSYTSLMAGRAKKMILHPLVYPELEKIKKVNINHILQFGTLPIVQNSADPWDELRDYTGLYLKEEILAESIVRKIENFSRFIDFAALTSGQVLNYESVASDAQVPARTIREYYSILKDTLMGEVVLPVKATAKRKSTATGKFYFFDVGVVNSIIGRKTITPKTIEYGFLFEHYIFNEVLAYRDYFNLDLKIEFWRIDQEHEVDLILNEDIAIEIKATTLISEKHLKGLTQFASLGKCSRKIVVSLDKTYRKINNDVEVFPFDQFLSLLWNKKIA
ncbi:MAG: AAA family ATPase [Bacteriovoracaceae bacterium]